MSRPLISVVALAGELHWNTATPVKRRCRPGLKDPGMPRSSQPNYRLQGVQKKCRPLFAQGPTPQPRLRGARDCPTTSSIVSVLTTHVARIFMRSARICKLAKVAVV